MLRLLLEVATEPVDVLGATVTFGNWEYLGRLIERSASASRSSHRMGTLIVAGGRLFAWKGKLTG